MANRSSAEADAVGHALRSRSVGFAETLPERSVTKGRSHCTNASIDAPATMLKVEGRASRRNAREAVRKSGSRSIL
ncbi:MAG: hypothetical protein F6J90_37125 [Moorea sp. SIOASIH]|uniref:hypothetical protein n=1 Tax=Moorena sp. SIOASIH TaxID=2607817 RepID=UPI0013B98608|nr:hypothetical protein [Moorena sp. SIOASIH]NEO41652.1 hypothetical protein [Moorena sp. SIOASIH]